MSTPTEFDFALLKIGDGATPTEAFVVSCGKQDFTANFQANSSNRFVRDCAKPGEIPFQKAKATGRLLDITASGLTDATSFGTEIALIGTRQNVKLEYYADNNTDAGELLGTVACNMLIQSLNIGTPREDASSAELQMTSNGAWTWTAAS